MGSVKLPEEYKDLNQCLILPILAQAINLYGVKEVPGSGDNPIIIDWAKEVNTTVGKWYKHDSEAWCALFVSVCAKRAGYQPPDGFDAVRAKSFEKWGDPISGEPILGDVLVFSRTGGGHVGIYVGEDNDYYHVLGGNQSDAVCITRIAKERMTMARRPPMNSCPKCAKRIYRTAKGIISTNEA